MYSDWTFTHHIFIEKEPDPIQYSKRPCKVIRMTQSPLSTECVETPTCKRISKPFVSSICLKLLFQLGIMSAAMFSGLALSQTTIRVQIPPYTNTSWSLNGQSYSGSTSSLTAIGVTDNTASFQNVTSSGLYQTWITPNSGLVTNTSTATPLVYTTMGVTLNNGMFSPTANTTYQFFSTGGASAPNVSTSSAGVTSISGTNYGFSANVGSNLTFGSTGVGASVILGQPGGQSSAYLIKSSGGAGAAFPVSNNQTSAVSVQPFFANGANGGSVTATIAPPTEPIGVTTPGQISVLVSGQPTIANALPWLVSSSAIQVSSYGGAGGGWTNPAIKGAAGADAIVGAGANGGNVSLTVGSENNGSVNIQLGNAQNSLIATPTSPVAGIVATSIGAPGGLCCAIDSNGNLVVGTSPTVNASGGADQSWMMFGSNGSAGSVSVQLNGTSILGSSSNLYGVVAASVGASTQVPAIYTLGFANPAPASGLGGPVSVSLSQGSIQLTGSNSVGIFAASLSNATIVQGTTGVYGSGGTAGAVEVSIGVNSGITIGTSNTVSSGQFSAGVVAISSTGWLFQPIGSLVPNASTAGNGGSVTVTNAGPISAWGNSALGIVALSLGNGGVLSNAAQTVNGVTYASQSNANAGEPNVGGSVTVNVTSTGIVSTNGNASIGVLAASNGSGGVIAGIPDVRFNSSSGNAQNILIGSGPSGYVAGAGSSIYTLSGGTVSINNSGTINTYGGIAAVGVLAQSVGGGGASFTQGTALYVGDAGGSGGSGGSINITNSGTIGTAGDASIGFLGQSIGGGGGHGANTKGLFVAVGGQGGQGGSGGNISATLQPGSMFSTSGDFSSGMILQSIGGGGGNGGFGKATGIFFSTGIGGAGGQGGNGGVITLASAATSSFASTSGNQSHGLLLQSIGGGGGTGGHAYSYSPGVIFAGAVAVGGSGGAGGAGGNISICSTGASGCTVPITGAISTGDSDSSGVFLQTIGGGGGYGGGASGKALALGVDPELPITVSVTDAIGGSGSVGGAGGSIQTLSSLNISTQGTGSHAIFAQSIGGGGGAGADSTAGANSYSSTEYTFNAAVGIGGSGAGGGSGGPISISTQSGSILSTVGHNATGIFAQSVGGGGGYGAIGNAYQNNVSSGADQVGIVFALGGNGQSGGAGGAVAISNAATITTIGSQSSGVLAQSISGGGGFGGNGGAQSAGGNYNFSLVAGGSAGGGFAGGAVTVTNMGNITTGMQLDLASNQVNSLNLSKPIAIGGDSHGIVAQSIGGGGGVGGNADPTASLISSVQSLINQGAGAYLSASGAEAYFTPSSTSSSSTSSSSTPASISYNGTVSIGGAGGSGGAGGNVTVNNSGSITTYGHRSYGILTQSIGGGGGIGGSSTASSSFLSGSASATIMSGYSLGLGLNVGGSSGSGGSGGTVFVGVSPSSQGPNPVITTNGYASHALVAQSIGGGGGIAHEGSVLSAAGTVGATNSISVTPSVTLGARSYGAGVQGSGGPVAATISTSLLVTTGDSASAVILQTIGGGGGIASFGCTNSGNAAPSFGQTNFNVPTTASACFQNANSTSTPIGLTPAAFQQSQGIQPFAVTINAASGVGNTTAGAINLTNSSQIITQGNRSIGIVAQSIGGGGGFVSAPAQTISSASLPTGGMNNSAGGQISLNMPSVGSPVAPNFGITTVGTGAWGILAQSIGAGGGFIGDPSFALNAVPSSNPSNSFMSGGSANGGSISINLGSSSSVAVVQPNITTNGQFAHGIVAQSIGGGGGITSYGNGNVLVGSTAGSSVSNQGSGGTIGINIFGSITTFGAQSMGVFAQSTGTTGSSGLVSINVAGSILVSPQYQTNGAIVPSAAAIMISGGSNDPNNPNLVTVNGLVGGTGTSSPQDINAIITGYGYTNVVNNGTISGSVNLGSTPGEFTNNGTFNAGQTVVVANNSLHNYGTLSIGGQGSISNTQMQGRLVQYDSGKLIVTVDSAKAIKNDYLIINGNAVLAGEIVPRAKSLLPGSFEFMTANSIVSSAKIRDSLIVDWSLSQVGNKLVMQPEVNFVPTDYSLTSNQESFARYIQQYWKTGEAAYATLFGYLHEYPKGDYAGYQNALNQLSGQVLNSQAIQMKTAFATSLSDSLSCPTITPQGLKLNESNCVWTRLSGNISDQSSSTSNSGFRATAGGVRLGAQRELGNDWSAGFALGYTNNYLTSSGLTSNGSFFDVSFSGQKKVEGWSFGSSLAFAQGLFNNYRTLQLGPNGVADSLSSQYKSNSSMSMAGLRFRGAYEVQQQAYYFKPYADIDFLYSNQPGYKESGDIFALNANSNSQFNIAITPMFEFGVGTVTQSEHFLKAYVSVGASFLPNNNVSTQLMFVNGLASAGTFNMVTSGPSVLGRFNVGVQVFNSDNLDVRAEYGLLAGGGYLNQTLSANLVYRY